MSRGGPSCPVTKMLPPPHLRAGSSIGSDWGLLPLLYQVTMAQRGNGNSNGNGNGNGTGGYGTDGLNANILKADILRRYVSCLDFKCSRSRTEQPPFFSVGSINQGLAQLVPDPGVIINRLPGDHNFLRPHLRPHHNFLRPHLRPHHNFLRTLHPSLLLQ